MIWLFLSGVVSGGGVVYLVARRQGYWSWSRPFTEADGDEVVLGEAREAVQARITKRKDRILAVVKAEGKITNDGVEDLYCISNSTAANYLSQLVEEGKLTRQGTGRGTYYTLPK